MRRLVFALTLAFLAGLPAIPAHSRDYRPEGGPGGSPFVDRCPAPSYLVGFRFLSGDWIDGIQPLCATFDPRGGQFGLFGEASVPDSGLGFHGGSTGGMTTMSCPKDAYLIAIRFGQSNDGYVDFVQFECSPMTREPKDVICRRGALGCYVERRSQTEQIYVPAYQRCETGEAAVGIGGRAGSYVDALGLMCDAAPDIAASVAAAATFCRTYATDAVLASAKSRDLSCERDTEGRWSLNYTDHLNYCLDFREGRVDTANFETQARKDGLAACGFEITKPNARLEPGARVSDTLEAMKPPDKTGVEDTGPGVVDVLNQTKPPDKTGVQDEGYRVSNVPGAVEPGPATVPAASPGYLIACSGGRGMTAASTNDGFVRIRFGGTLGGLNMGYPEPGKCAWADRGFRPGEPLMLAYQRQPGDDKIVKDLLRAAKNGGQFQVHANNDGNGAMLVTSLDRVEPLPASTGLPDPHQGAQGALVATVISAVSLHIGDKKSKIVVTLHAGTQVVVAGCDNFWCRVLADVPGGFGFVSRKYLAVGEIASSSGAEPMTMPKNKKPAPVVETDNPDNPPPPVAAAADISGTWDSHTDKGWQYTIFLEAGPGGGVSGSYTAQDGSQALLSGKLKGSVLSFNWATIPPTYKGLGRFTFNGDSFSGSYNTTEFPDPTDPAILTGTWTGTRQ